MKSAIPFLIKKTHKVLDKIDKWALKKIEENKIKEEEKKNEKITSK